VGFLWVLHFFLVSIIHPVFHTYSLYNHSQQHYELEHTNTACFGVVWKNVNGQQESGIQKKVITFMIGSKSIFL
jgi:hypothetical protein